VVVAEWGDQAEAVAVGWWLSVTSRQAKRSSCSPRSGAGSEKKPVLTVSATFASVADDPSTTCSSTPLQGQQRNGSLDVYEDWRQTPSCGRPTSPKMSAPQKRG